jgi:rfaE bifunctional protein nucleotidyltransferase chain/domain
VIFDKIKELDEMESIVREAKERGEVIVTTNGCFDIPHAAHFRLLENARNLGTRLIVLVNDDNYLRQTKRKSVQVEMDRAYMIACLGFVDYVSLFHEPTVLESLARIKPHIHVKGGTYIPERIRAEKELLAQWGGRLHLFPLEEGYATTNLLNRIISLYENGELVPSPEK